MEMVVTNVKFQKVKELTYMHSEGILAGELKHGPLALIDETMPVLFIVMKDPVYSKCMNALQQVIIIYFSYPWINYVLYKFIFKVISRKGKPIIICQEDDKETLSLGYKCLQVPKTVDCLQGILTVIPMQLLSFHIAVMRGYDVDCPRNLAKSVTTE